MITAKPARALIMKEGTPFEDMARVMRDLNWAATHGAAAMGRLNEIIDPKFELKHRLNLIFKGIDPGPSYSPYWKALRP